MAFTDRSQDHHRGGGGKEIDGKRYLFETHSRQTLRSFDWIRDAMGNLAERNSGSQSSDGYGSKGHDAEVAVWSLLELTEDIHPSRLLFSAF